MTKSELIDSISRRQQTIPAKDIKLAVNLIIETLTEALTSDQRIEVRGFGAFTTRYRKPRLARNPKTGVAVHLASKRAIHFKPGKELKESLETSTVPLASNVK
jgi:integration host factor subunit beta